MTSVLKTSRRRPPCDDGIWRHFRRRRRDQHDEIAPSIKPMFVRPSICLSLTRAAAVTSSLVIHSRHFTHDVRRDLSLIAAAERATVFFKSGL